MIAVYPGSFDPITCGHLDIIERSCRLFDTVYVAVLQNSSKTPLFSVEERKEMIERVTSHFGNVKVADSDGLLVDFAKSVGAQIIVKGLRAVSDFEYEFQMALINRKLEEEIETMFLMTSAQNQYLSSSIVKNIAAYGSNLDGLVPPEIMQDIYDKLKR